MSYNLSETRIWMSHQHSGYFKIKPPSELQIHGNGEFAFYGKQLSKSRSPNQDSYHNGQQMAPCASDVRSWAVNIYLLKALLKILSKTLTETQLYLDKQVYFTLVLCYQKHAYVCVYIFYYQPKVMESILDRMDCKLLQYHLWAKFSISYLN